MRASIENARDAKQQLQQRLAGDRLVNGIGLRREPDGWVVQVNTIEPPAAGHELPDTVGGVDVHYSTIGRVVKQQHD
jgi:hypothetical protein